MKVIIPNLYAEYGRYINRFRAIPYYIDVLKSVERRLILSLYEECKTHDVKSAKVIGTAIAKYHPHGDQSTYQVLVNLVYKKFAIGQGNWGNFYGLKDSPAAAYRYTEVRINPDLVKLFEETLKFVKWETLELEPEPLYLPSPVPIGLIGFDIITGISFYTTKIPQYSIQDLVKRLKSLILNSPKKEVIIPNIINCDLVEKNGNDFETILTKGEGSIQITPKLNIDKKSIEIIGKCPIYGFSKLIKNAEKLEIVIDDLSKVSYGTKILITPAKRRPIDQQLIDDIKECISFTINFLVNVVDDNGVVKQMSIDDILLLNYEKWMESHNNLLLSKLNTYKDKLFENQVIAIVRKIIENNPSAKTVDEIVKLYENKYKQDNVSNEDVKKICSKYTIKSLIEHKTDETVLQKEIRTIQHYLNNLEEYCYNILETV